MDDQISVYVVTFTDQHGCFHWWAVKAFSPEQATKLIEEAPENVEWKAVTVNRVDMSGIGPFLKT